MAADGLGLPERAALVILAASGGELPQARLVKEFGVNLKGPQFARLVDRGLLLRTRAGRSFALALTDAGWDHLGGAIAEAPPRGSGSGGKALWLLLAALGQRGVGLRDLLAGAPEADAGDRSAPLGERIAAAYAALAPEPRGWVPLRALRERLADVDRAELDEALRRLRRDKALTMTLEDDQGRLTRADRDAAIRIGADDMHYVAMD